MDDKAKPSSLRSFFTGLRKKRIIEILAAFIAGGWLIVEVVDRLLVSHYLFPEETIDITVITLVGALLSILIWRWFMDSKKRPGSLKIEVLLVPLIVLAVMTIDLCLIFDIAGITGKKLMAAIIALCVGIAWIVFKSLQWAAHTPESGKKEIETLKPTMVKPEKSIVVLPFADLSPLKDQEYFCDGMTEEIITDLSHVHELLVISRSSAMTFKGANKTIPEIAGAVNVRYVLEGSVRKAGNNLRISAQLIDSSTDAHLWAEKYDGTLDDVFDIQEKVSCSISNALKLKLTPEEREWIVARPIANPTAYDLHIRARHETWQATEPGLERASRFIKRGLDLIGDNEILYADLGFVYLMYIDAGIKKDERILIEAEECIQKVFSLNPGSAYGHYLRGMIQRKKRNYPLAVKEFKKSLAIDPNHPDPLMWLGWVCGHSGRILEARQLLGRLLKIDPLNLFTYFLSGIIEIFGGKFSEGTKELDKALQLDEQNPFIKFWVAMSLSYAHLLEEAHNLFNRIEKESPGTIWASLASFHKHALENKRPEALQTVTTEFRSLAKDDEMFGVWVAESYALIGETSEANEWIENAVDSGFINYPFLVEYDPFLAKLSGEPRFQKLMERVKKEWEEFEV